MKCSRALILPFLVFHLRLASSATNTRVDTDCNVRSKIVFNIQEGIPLNISFVLTPEDPITIQVAIVGMKSSLNNDLLILKHKGGEIQHTRDGSTSLYDIILRNYIPVGWNIMNIIMQDGKINLGNFYTLTGFEYDANDISFTAKYVTSCANGTPKWKINRSNSASIPLIGTSIFEIRLHSDKQFLPDLFLNDINIPLSYEEGLVLEKSNKYLPADEYRIVFLKEIKMLYIFTISMGEEYNLLMKGNLKNDLIDLKVKTLDGDFLLTLDPFLKIKFEVETTIIKQSPDIQERYIEYPTPEPEVEDTLHTKESECKCNWPIIMALASGISIGALLMLLIIKIYHFRRTKIKYNEDFNMEEGANLLSQTHQVSVKYTIKQEYTEPCGELNPQFPLYQKEICKLKLLSNKNHSNKRIPGELDQTKQTKVILVVGETGSGKSSAINGMINHIYGIAFEDPFRFKLVHDMDLSNSSGINTTKEITSYHIPFSPGIANDSNYILIDTPGFGDSRGVDEDRKLVSDFYHFLKKNQDIQEVDGIVFLIKASDTRLTDIQEYVINGLFSMFGKDVRRNIYVFVSFSNGSVTHVAKILKDSGLEYNFAIHFNDNGIFNDVTKIEDVSQESEEMVQQYFHLNWKMTMDGMGKFFEALKMKTPVSLLLTSIVLEENKDINKLTDDLLELMAKESTSKDEEKLIIGASIEENQTLFTAKLVEAKKLFGRLKDIPYKSNPLSINDYIDILIKNETNEKKIRQLNKLKNRNTTFQNLLKKKE